MNCTSTFGGKKLCSVLRLVPGNVSRSSNSMGVAQAKVAVDTIFKTEPALASAGLHRLEFRVMHATASSLTAVQRVIHKGRKPHN